MHRTNNDFVCASVYLSDYRPPSVSLPCYRLLLPIILLFVIIIVIIAAFAIVIIVMVMVMVMAALSVASGTQAAQSRLETS